MKNIIRHALLAVSLILPVIASAQTQSEMGISRPGWAVKTNLLYDATATVNLGVEVRTGRRTSLDLPFSYNGWTVQKGRQWEHFLAQPEFRLWTREAMGGHFFGFHGHYANYDISHLPFTQYTKPHRFDGWLAGAGASYGYRWNLSRRMALEAAIGVGYAYMSYDRHSDTGMVVGEAKHYFGPTKAALSLSVGIGGGKTKKAVIPVVPAHVPQPAPQPVPVYEPKFEVSYVIPEAEAVKTRSESGRAYLDFAAGRTEIVADFKNNAVELGRMRELIESVTDNPDATITAVTIVGHASPESTYDINLTLSERRAQALRNYIGMIYGLPASLFSVSGAGEDWEGLEELVEQSDVPRKEQVLRIIRNVGIFDGREKRLMDLAGGEPYRWMRAMLFPKLRRVEYRIDYTVSAFTVERSKEVMKTRPGTLSLNELYMIARTYPVGSDDFNKVFELAAVLYPDSDIANLNAAACALERKDTASATRHLARIEQHNDAYWNNMGILALLTGDRNRAAECFLRGGGHGEKNAAELAKSGTHL